MTTTTIEIADKKYNVKVALTQEESEQGLMGVESLAEDEGMLFPFEEEDEVSFWMKDTTIPLDIVFLDEDLNVIQVSYGKPNDETPITGRAKDVLEVNVGSLIRVGDVAYFIDENDKIVDEPKVKDMYILGSDGTPQATIEGGERIFSRSNSVTLIRMAKRAFRSKSDPHFRALGKKAFKYLEIQDGNLPEYVTLPE